MCVFVVFCVSRDKGLVLQTDKIYLIMSTLQHSVAPRAQFLLTGH